MLFLYMFYTNDHSQGQQKLIEQHPLLNYIATLLNPQKEMRFWSGSQLYSKHVLISLS